MITGKIIFCPTAHRPLTNEERRWIKSLARLMEKQPETIELSTIGDHQISVWCVKKRKEIDAMGEDICDGNVERHGGGLASIITKAPVHGVSG